LITRGARLGGRRNKVGRESTGLSAFSLVSLSLFSFVVAKQTTRGSEGDKGVGREMSE